MIWKPFLFLQKRIESRVINHRQVYNFLFFRNYFLKFINSHIITFEELQQDILKTRNENKFCH